MMMRLRFEPQNVEQGILNSEAQAAPAFGSAEIPCSIFEISDIFVYNRGFWIADFKTFFSIRT